MLALYEVFDFAKQFGIYWWQLVEPMRWFLLSVYAAETHGFCDVDS